MIDEIGLVIGLYILVRTIPARFAKIIKVVSLVTGVISVFVVVDSATRVIVGKTVFAMAFSEPSVDAAPSVAVAPGAKATVTKADGGSIRTDLGYGIAVAKGSTLRREWITVHSPFLPVDIEGTAGVTTKYIPKSYGGQYVYNAELSITTTEAISAYEVRFLTFDVWGDHIKTLRLDGVTDIEPGSHKLDGQWSLHSENDVEKHYASVAYVARVRLKNGKVIVAPSEPVLEEARKISAKFSPAQLEPVPPPIPPVAAPAT